MTLAGRIQARIDLSALRHNFLMARGFAGASRLVAVVKANAYGHGLETVAETLREADLFGVTDLVEARRLRATGLDNPVLILQGFMDREDIALLAESGFHLLVHSLEQLAVLDEELTARPPPAPLSFWLKADTGMGRLGLLPRDYAEAARRLRARPYTREVVLMSHLANASLPDSPLTAKQLKTFAALQDELPQLPTSLSSSSGLLGQLVHASDWVRPGIMLYGSSPFAFNLGNLRADKLGLRPVMTLQARLIAVKEMKAGENVGYCSQFVCPRDMRVGTVACGYADGYPSHAPNGTPVLVNGQRTQTVGRVSMDMLAVDLSGLPEARPGDVVTLWGQGLPVDEVAQATGVISYNLLCSVSRRVPFHYGRD